MAMGSLPGGGSSPLCPSVHGGESAESPRVAESCWLGAKWRIGTLILLDWLHFSAIFFKKKLCGFIVVARYFILLYLFLF